MGGQKLPRSLAWFYIVYWVRYCSRNMELSPYETCSNMQTTF